MPPIVNLRHFTVMSHLIAENEIGTEIKKSETFKCLSNKYGGRNEQMYRFHI